VSGEPCPEREEKPQRPRRLTDKQRAERQAAAIEAHWRTAGHSNIKTWVTERELLAGRHGRHWSVESNLQNGLPPS
jgi:hypothetical protein